MRLSEVCVVKHECADAVSGLRALYCSLRLLKSTKQWPAKSLFYSEAMKRGYNTDVQLIIQRCGERLF